MRERLLSPLSLIRSADTLARPLFAKFEAIAVEAVLLARSDLLADARLLLVETNIPRSDDGRTLRLQEMQCWFQSLYTQTVESALSAEGIDRPSVTEPPHQDFDSAAYCPRCHGQYTRQLNCCPSYIGVRTALF